MGGRPGAHAAEPPPPGGGGPAETARTMDDLKAAIEARKAAAAAARSGPGGKFVRRSELEADRVKRMREEEEQER